MSFDWPQRELKMELMRKDNMFIHDTLEAGERREHSEDFRRIYLRGQQTE